MEHARDAFFAWEPPPSLGRVLLLEEDERVERVTDGERDPLCALLERVDEDGLRVLQHGWTALPTVPAEDMDQFVAQATRLVVCAWQWHRTVHDALLCARVSLALQRLPRMVLEATWTLFTQATLLVRVAESCRDDGGLYDRHPLAVLVPAHTFRVVQRLAESGRCAIALSEEDLLAYYSVSRWHTALLVFLNAHSALTGWTPSADAYLSALFLRYAQLMQEHTDEPAATYDDLRFCRPRDFAPPRLNSTAFVGDLAAQLYPVLRHNAAARAWAAQGGPPRETTGAVRRQRIAAWAAFVRAVAEHAVTREPVVNRVRTALLRRLLRPGDVARMAWRDGEPLRNVAPDQALFALRPDVYRNAAVPLLKAEMVELMDRWAAAATASPALDGSVSDAEGWEQAAAARPEHEAVALLVCETCLDVWWEEQGYSRRWSFAAQAYVDDASLLPPHDAPPGSPADALRAFGGVTPIFVAVDKVYCCVTAAEATTATPHVLDALTEWLVASVAERGVPVHPKLQCLVPVADDA